MRRFSFPFSGICAIGLVGCAHAAPISDIASAKEAAVMTNPSPAATVNPQLSAEEIGKRFLKLIESLESRDDLSLERIKEVMGLTLTVEAGEISAAIGSGDLGGGWRYVFRYVPGNAALKRGVVLSFVNNEAPYSDMSSVCGLDFEYYDQAFKAMGLYADTTYGEIGQLLSFEYAKFKQSDGSVDFIVSLIPQNVVAGEAGRLCIRSVGTLN